MSDKETNDHDVQQISDRLQSVATIEPACNNAQPQQQQQAKNSRRNGNNDATRHAADSKKAGGAVATGTVATATATTTTADDHVRVRNVPELNLPEKILLVVDTVREQQCTPFKLGTGATYPPLFMIKRVVESFVGAKSTIQPGVHEYALMSLGSRGASWLCDYTSNTKTVLNHLESVAEDVPDEEHKTYDLGLLFEVIHARAATPARCQPTFTSRVILIYGRSNSVPKFHTGQKYLENLTENPYFFLDVLFAHEPPGNDNMCEAVYAEIAALDTTSFSYIFEVGRNAAKIHDNMAKLLAHPLQRPPQKDASYTFYLMPGNQEVHTNV
ncbi:PREDICTED: BRISC and BRCA1-A complex member 1-like [Vollenhovia emeryi]|uniref:BRISC and BRCA1-A complex member 1-like n=1 Tax=Vollenhovia emeryi TaxID=411798 RepID=UPI0005F3904E|nr:PREDICTED: BRISC and BRCA1-A complex member 1-like [Vollenhovia emeryi]